MPPLGVLVARWQVIDPSAWCGAATTALCGGCGDPLPSWRSSLVEIPIEVTGDLARVLVVNQDESQKRLGDWKAILLLSASTTWIRDSLMPIDTT
jgi:hypothetical protein